jgi:hypothetical protein
MICLSLSKLEDLLIVLIWKTDNDYLVLVIAIFFLRYYLYVEMIFRPNIWRI